MSLALLCLLDRASSWYLNKDIPTWCHLLYYVYRTVHHLDSWIKIDQLDVTCFIISLFTPQHVSDVNTSILRSLRLICWVISCVVLLWFDVCWCYGVVRLVWSGIVMQVWLEDVSIKNINIDKTCSCTCHTIPGYRPVIGYRGVVGRGLETGEGMLCELA